MWTIHKIAKLLVALLVASTLSFTAMADSHEAGESAGADEVEASDTTDAPPVDSAPPESDEAAGDTAEEAQD
ncbi:MAG: hypothetical protein JRG92_02535 [Deltaproteobacteria bacterium]|jgi:hypothetical protein|nr:hypothetical protein [Deltaproteobacteria bacterium]MBW2382479.1 hypothetical protein [Deltaproteobacteria bacterium]MBW2694959.1 hypothetical protein [Deltaproteobacteria bacterium]